MSTASTTSVLSSERAQSEFKNFGRAALADYFGDFVIYRNLEPLDRRLPGLRAASYKMNLSSDQIPRKLDTDYAKAAIFFAMQGQKLRRQKIELSELLFIGDTPSGDGQAYANMRQLSGWQGSCFIGSERPNQELVVDIDEEDAVYCANRWSALADWVRWTLQQGMRLDGRTAVIADIDKTALGAKGRNDQVINEARLEGMFRTMTSVLGDRFDRAAFEREYAELNRSRYHFLTADNQDYLAYICLVLNVGLVSFEEILDEIKSGSMDNFEQFLRWVGSRLLINPGAGESIRQIHEAVVCSVRTGDPTPFKQFRRQEFVTTIERMGNMPDDAAIDELLAREITLTNEVCELAAWLNARGSLLLCLSDKPDEASCPDAHVSPDLPPIHRAQTHRIGVGIQDVLGELG